MIKNREDLLQFGKGFTEVMMHVLDAKNQDYAGTGEVFANFTRVEALGICKPEIGFLTRMSDKMSRLATFANKGELAVKSESVHDTLMDLANYCLLMAAYLERNKKIGEVG